LPVYFSGGHKPHYITTLIDSLPEIQILVKTVEGKKIPLEVNGGNAVRWIKQQLMEKEGVE
jgi:hypothetical protein